MAATGNLAAPLPDEAAYLAAWAERWEGVPDEAPPGFLQRTAVSVASTLLQPANWALHLLAQRQEAQAIAADLSRTEGYVAHRMRTHSEPPRDLSAWRLHTHEGRHIWALDPASPEPQDRISAMQCGAEAPSDTEAASLPDALSRGGDYLASIQSADGHWANDYGGPNFLIIGMVVAKYIIHKGDRSAMLPEEHVAQLVRYMRNVQNLDGGWGMFEQGPSTMFGSVANYVSMRLLGVPASDPRLQEARAFIARNGGAAASPPWCKGWLAVCNLFSWEGVSPMTPEMWLLPKWVPIHPSRMWCHARMVYIPFSYLYGVRYQAPLDPLIASLREELFGEGRFASVDWRAAADEVCPLDNHNPTHPLASLAFAALRMYERVAPKSLRTHSLGICLDHIEYEECTTSFLCVGPVNKMLNLLVMHVSGAGSPEHQRLSEARVMDYLYLGKDGMKVTGYNGSQLWDTSFALQAMRAAGVLEAHPDAAARGAAYLDVAQVMQTPPCPRRYNRDDPYGAYNFSTSSQGWQVSDCTAEGLRAVLELDALPTARVRAAVDQLLLLRNPDDGAWSSYEARRSPTWFELFDPANVFMRIMVEYTHTECTSASMQALAQFAASPHSDAGAGGYRASEIRDAMRCGAEAIKARQLPNGSWYGNWAVCFTYATMFAIQGLLAAGEPASGDAVSRAVAFLLSKQRADGGWSENVVSCVTWEYTECSGADSLPVQTAWALMGLVAAAAGAEGGASQAHRGAMGRAAALLVASQRGGTWQQEEISGIFNGTCGIHYPFYPAVFPLWALGRYRQYLQSEGGVA